MWRWIWRPFVAVLGIVAATVVTLRFVDPPTTAFMLHARLTAWRAGADLAIAQDWVAGACLPRSLKLAVIAAEDQKFPMHWGFDVTQIVSALEEAEQGGRLRGASTLTQQTAKNLFLWPGQSWARKGLEAGLAGVIELTWPKTRILEVYLNVAEFGSGIYGAGAAARHYFGKPALVLSAAESALLAAALPNPKLLRVDAPSDYVRERQRWILEHMNRVSRLPGVSALVEESATCSSRADTAG